MRRAAFVVSLSLGLSSASCGRNAGMYAPGKSAAKSDANEPHGKFDFAAEMKKESTGLKPFTVSAPDGSFTAKVSASAAPQVTVDDKAVSIALEIGSKRPMDCAIFDKRIDAASTLWTLGVEPLAKMPTQEVLGTEVGADEDRPFLTLNMAAVNEAKEAFVMKVTAVMLADAAVVCRHEEIGYVTTAKSVALELARTLTKSRTGKTVPFHEIHVLKLDGTPMGWHERFVFDGETGGAFEIAYDATLISKGNGVLVSDAVSTTEVDKDGFVKTVTRAEGNPDGLSKRLVLQRAGATSYEVDGEVGDNKVHTKLTSKKPIRGMALTAQDIVANARATKAVPYVEESWSSTRPPGEISVSTYTRQPRFDPKAPAYTVKNGNDEMSVTFDAEGHPTRVTSKMDGLNVEMSRVFFKGPQRKK
jgi:hypothetical protein